MTLLHWPVGFIGHKVKIEPVAAGSPVNHRGAFCTL